jgi:hypothetical protein
MGDDAIDRSQAWRAYDQLWADERVLWAEEPAELDAVWRAISFDREMPARYPSVQVELLLP